MLVQEPVAGAAEVQELPVLRRPQRREHRVELVHAQNLRLVDGDLREAEASRHSRPSRSEDDLAVTREADLLGPVRVRRVGPELGGQRREQPPEDQLAGVGSMARVENALALERGVGRVQLTDETLSTLTGDEERGLERRQLSLVVHGQEVVQREPLPIVQRVPETLRQLEHLAAASPERGRKGTDTRTDHFSPTQVLGLSKTSGSPVSGRAPAP